MEPLSYYDPDQLKVIKPKNDVGLDIRAGDTCPTCKQRIEKKIARIEVEKVMTVFKMCLGFDKHDKSWDRAYYRRYAPTAVQMINFLGNWEMACDAIQQIMEESAAAGYRIYKLQTVFEKFQKWKLDYLEREARGPK